jgi:hypothetical protein
MREFSAWSGTTTATTLAVTASHLHPAVFCAWLRDVVAECERIWGCRPKFIPIMGGASGFRTSGRTTSSTTRTRRPRWRPTTPSPRRGTWRSRSWPTTTPSPARRTATPRPLPTYTGYAANAVPAANMNAGSAGSSSNNAAIQFAAVTAGTSTIVGYGNNSVQANTSGTFRKWGDCASTAVSVWGAEGDVKAQSDANPALSPRALHRRHCSRPTPLAARPMSATVVRLESGSTSVRLPSLETVPIFRVTPRTPTRRTCRSP